MKKKNKISVFEIKQLIKRLNQINKLNIDDIDFIDNDGDVIEINQQIIDDFKFTGLNTFDFIATDFYLKELKNIELT